MSALAAVAAVLLLGACQPAYMRVAPTLAGMPVYAVEGANPRKWNSPVSFGPWQTTTAREGMRWDFGLPLLGITAGYATQPYRLVIAGNGPVVQAECVSRAASLARKSLAVDPTFGRLPALACGFRGAGEGTLRLRTTATNTEEGTIDFGDGAWTVRSVSHYEGSPLPSPLPLGYEISRNGFIHAGVETINRGRVWIDPALPAEDQARLAAAITALLLYVPASGG